MAHGIEQDDRVFFGGNVPAWHGLGQVIEQDTVTTREAIDILGLDWDVIQTPHRIVMPDGSIHEVPREFQNHRSTDGKYLGTVGNKYVPFQNQLAFSFGDRLVDDHGAKWHTGGTLFDCKQAWMLMKLPTDVYVAGEPTEQIQPFVCFKNSHDGSCAVTMFTTFTRVVCNNTLGWALQGTKRKHTIRHSGRFEDPAALEKYILQAQEKLGIVFDVLAQMEREGAQMMRPRASAFRANDFDRMLTHILPGLKDDYKNEAAKKKAEAVLSERREKFFAYFTRSENIDNVRFTKWGALQAVIETQDHAAQTRDHGVNDPREVRFQRIIEGQDVVQKAYDYLIAA